ncbi:hypothetical protein FQN55_009311 [Onygenales sp. PD_40]|nr:hypothetical protein FQN55_009311 [Onygenales sp. PD_40]KAK2801943.1 hypothetical protein FQN51_005092 [Onygenales sp. PD_10]
MAYAGLTSHHVNYLIWRYLQESGYGEAALMLQRAWNQKPQDFPFASYIKPHALITLIQKGVQYYDLERSIDQAGNPNPSPPESFFGPVASDVRPSRETKDQPDLTDGALVTNPPPSLSKSPVQPTIDGVVNGHKDGTPTPLSGKGRKSTSVKDGDANVKPDETLMDIDQQESAQEHPSESSPVEHVVDADGDIGMREQEREPSPPIFTLTVGQSTGVQITPSKAADLGPDTILLDVDSDSHITQTLWRPDDPTVVAAAGDIFCGIWKLSSSRSSSGPAYEPVAEIKPDQTSVTALGWDSSGKVLAVATYSESMNGSVTLYSKEGAVLDTLPDLPRMVSGIHWAPHNLQVLVVLSDGEQSELTLWDPSLRSDELSPPKSVDGPIHGVSWCGDDVVYACGDGTVYEYHANNDIQAAKTFTSSDGREPWTFITTTTTSSGSPVAIAASSSTTNIWIPTHGITASSVHHGDITALKLRPQQKGSALLFATSSMDDTVKIWSLDLESKEIHCIHRLYMGPSFPALSSSFSPDGYAIAAASHDRLLIWNVERGGVPMAKWIAPNSDVKNDSDQDGLNTMNSLEDASFDRSLSWDSDGKKLALAFGKQMAIVNLQR